MDSGILRDCKVAAVLFKANGIYYDVDVPLSRATYGAQTYQRWPNLPGGLIDPSPFHPAKNAAAKTIVVEIRNLLGEILDPSDVLWGKLAELDLELLK